MQKTPQQLAAELEADIIEFDQASRGLLKPREEYRIKPNPPKIIWLNDDRGRLH